MQKSIGDLFTDEQGNPLNGGEGSLGHVGLHALAGCLAAEARGAACASGAAGAVVGAVYSGLQEAPRLEDFGGDAEAYGEAFAAWRAGMLEASQQLGLVAGFMLSGGDAEDFSTILQTSQSVVANNYLTHAEEAEFSTLLESCHVSRSQEACARLDELKDVSAARDEELEDCVGDHSDACVRARWILANTAAEFLELALTGESQLDERALLGRHLVVLDAHRYAENP